MNASPELSTDPKAARRRRLHFERAFFCAMVILMLVTVGIGFYPSYYSHGAIRAALPSRVLHVHGAVFTSWMLLLLVQTALVAARRVKLHQQLGVVGLVLACLVLALGFAAAGDAVARHGADNDSALVPLTDVALFAVLTGLGLLARKRPATHKRLILLGSAAMLTPALFRWPFAFMHHEFYRSVLATEAFLLLLVAYDVASTRTIHRATWMGGAAMIFVHWARLPLGDTAAWHAVDVWLATAFS